MWLDNRIETYMLKWHRDKVVFRHGELRTDPTTKPAKSNK